MELVVPRGSVVDIWWFDELMLQIEAESRSSHAASEYDSTQS